MSEVENRLTLAGYQKSKGNVWIKGNKKIQVVHSKEWNRDCARVTWKDKWEDYQAIIYDCTSTNCPAYVVPTQTLFNSDFVSKKRKQRSYANSGYWWTQKFPIDHELPRLIIKYGNRWDIIQKY